MNSLLRQISMYPQTDRSGKNILPLLSTQLARLLFPSSLSPVTSTKTAAKYIYVKRRRRSNWGGCVPVWCLWLLVVSLFSNHQLQNNFPKRLHHRLQGDNLQALDTLGEHADLQIIIKYQTVKEIWLLTIKVVKIYSCNSIYLMLCCFSLNFFLKAQGDRAQRDAHQSETLRSSWLPDLPPGCCHKQSVSGRTVQRVRNPPLVKTCQVGGGEQRPRMREWGKGQTWMLQLLLWSWTWMSYTRTAVFQLCGLACHLWQRDYRAGRSVHAHQLRSPDCSSAQIPFSKRITRTAVNGVQTAAAGSIKIDEKFAWISALIM